MALPLRRVSNWVVGLVLPLAVLGAVLAVFIGELASVDHELHLIAPAAVLPRRPVPMQALLFSGIGGNAVPELAAAEVEVTARRGEVVVSALLEPSPAGGASGSLPPLGPGTYGLRAIARIDGRAVASLDSTLLVSADAPPAPLSARLARAVQQQGLAPVEDAEGRLSPRPLDVRVPGGACVPETRCSLLIHVGTPAASVRLVHSPAITPRELPDVMLETEGLVELAFTAHGPDVETVVEALRGGEVVGQRHVRIPVALATPGLNVEAPMGEGPPALQVRVLGDRPGVIIDAFRGGHWSSTSHFEAPDGGRATLRLEAEQAPGRVQIQVRTDPFGAHHAAVRTLFLGDQAAPLDEALLALGGAEAPPPGPSRLRFMWAAAPLEVGLRALPPSVSGREADQARVDGRQEVLRLAALIAIVLGIAVLSLVFVRRGLDAATEAQQIMASTGDPSLASAQHRRRTLLSAFVIVGTALLAFLGAAALVIARARLLE